MHPSCDAHASFLAHFGKPFQQLLVASPTAGRIDAARRNLFGLAYESQTEYAHAPQSAI